jgi:hypothetical protein
MEEEGTHLANITYKLDLRGERSVTFGFDIRIERWVHVIPPTLNIGRLRSTSGQDLVRVGRVDIGRSIFKHGKGYVEMKLTIPGQNHRPFPLDTKLPFTVTVTTFSVPVCADSDPHTDKDALCPLIDVAALHLLLRLGFKRYTTLRVRDFLSVKQRNMTSYRVLPNFQQRDALDVNTGSKEWVAYVGDDQKLKGKGHWKQEFIFTSSITLSSEFATPTFRHLLIDVNVRVAVFLLCYAMTLILYAQYALQLECIIPSQQSFLPNHHITIKLPIVISYEIYSASSTRSGPLSPLLFVFCALWLKATPAHAVL